MKLQKVEQMQQIVQEPQVNQMFQEALQENKGAFIAGLIDLYNSDNYLQNCDPRAVVMESLKAASIGLPINKQLGFAYIVPYKQGGQLVPQMQIGYKGLIQLAMRTGQFRYLNADKVYQGMRVETDYLTGKVSITGSPKPDAPVVGYFAYMELINGFSKAIYMTKDEVEAHGKQFSKSYNFSGSTWKSNFDAMGIKTVLRKLLSKYAPLSSELKQAQMMEPMEEPDVVEVVDEETGEILESHDAPF